MALSAREGHTGTYGGVDEEYEGFRIYIDASVGSLSDPSLEAQELEDNQARARADLAAIEPSLLTMYQHFASGKHPYATSRRHLDRVRRAPGPSGPECPLAVSLIRPFDASGLGGGTVDVWVMLYVQPGLSPSELDRLASAFAAAQRAPGGVLADDEGGEWRTLDLARSQLDHHVLVMSGGPAGQMFRLLDHARRHRTAMHALVTTGDPLATAIAAVPHGKPLKDDLYDRLGAVAPERLPVVIRILALLAPDRSRARTLERLRQWHAAHPIDATLGPWLEALAR